MAQPIFGYANKLDAGTLSGGDWRTDLPLTNLQDRRLSRVARSVTDATADTQFDLDIGASETIRAVSIHAHNLSLSGTIRVRGYDGAGHTSFVTGFDSTALNPYEVYPSGVLQAGHPAFGTTTLAQVDKDAGYPVDFIYVLPTPLSARYLWIEIDDTTNPDTYVQIGRAFVAYGYQPTHGVSVGQRLGYETESETSVSEGGSFLHDERPRRRVLDVSLRMFGEDESLVYLHELNRRLGTTNQCLYIGNPDDSVHMHRQSFLGVLRRLRPLSFTRSQFNDQGFTVVEEL